MSDEQNNKMKYLSDLDAYFKLKKKYETKWFILKKKNLINIKNKRKDGKMLISNLQRKCINCNKVGGTIFTRENNIFIAKCNAEERKCSLNIQIKPGNYINSKKYENMVNNKIKEIKNKIINNKLNLLFDLENDDVIINEFNSLKDELKKESERLKNIKQEIVKLDIIPINDVNDDDMKDDDMKDDDMKDDDMKKDGKQKGNKIIFKKDKIIQLKIKLDEFIKTFKTSLKEYRANNTNKTLLNNSINIYISNILPILEQIRNLENKNIYIDKTNTADLSEPNAEFKLIKKKYFIEDEELSYSEYNVLKMNVKKKIYSTKTKTIKSTNKKLSVSKQVLSDIGEDIHKEEELKSFKPVTLQTTKGNALDSSEIKIDIDKLKELDNNKGEDMSDYMDDELIKSRDQEDLYNKDTVFKFYSRSANDVPGKGKAGGGETISQEEIGDFEELARIPNWRKVLSNFHVNKDGYGNIIPLFNSNDGGTILNWASVEHWYHAHKFKKNNPEYFKLFTMNSKSEISTEPRKALGAGGRTGYIKNSDGKRVLFRDASIKMDDDFFNGYNEEIMEQGQRLKYNQDNHSKRVLLATKNAKLVHLETRRGQKTNLVPFINTMKIRRELIGQ